MKVFTNLKRAGIVFVCLTAAVVFGCFVTKSETASEAAVPVMSERVLVPGGNSVGVRMDVKGVLIVGLEEIDTKDGNTVNPGLDAGLEIGDTILEINGKKVYKASEVQELVNEVKDTVKLKVQRKDRSLNIELSPVVAEDDGLYKLGVWIKDKTAGIGTLTFYDPETEKVWCARSRNNRYRNRDSSQRQRRRTSQFKSRIRKRRESGHSRRNTRYILRGGSSARGA